MLSLLLLVHQVGIGVVDSMEAANAALTLQTQSYAVNRFFQGSCCAPSPADDLTLDVTVTDEVEPEEPEQKTAPPKGHLLRICVHHGLDLPRHETQLEVVANQGLKTEQRWRSSSCAACFSPTWDFNVELPILLHKPPTLKVEVLSLGFLAAERLGSVDVDLSHLVLDEISQKLRLEMASLSNVDAEVVLVWQCTLKGKGNSTSAVSPSLSRVAELGIASMQQRLYHVFLDLKSLHFRKGLETFGFGFDDLITIFPQIALAIGILTSSIGARVHRFCGFVLGGLSGRVWIFEERAKFSRLFSPP